MTESDTISSNVSDSSLSKAPGAQLSNHQSMRIESLVFSNTQQEEQDARKAVMLKKLRTLDDDFQFPINTYLFLLEFNTKRISCG